MEWTALFLLWTALHFVETLNELPNPTHIRYSRDFLLNWSNFRVNNPPSDLIFPNLSCFADKLRGKGEFTDEPPRKTRKRGKRGGVLHRLRKQSLSRFPLPSIILSNAQSLRNKTDELQANVRFQHEFRDACLLAITETWFSESDLNSELVIDGFGAPVRLDRDASVTGRSRGGGVCLYVNQRYCKNVLVRESLCTKDVELLSVSLRPPYLPREFPQIFVTVVYIHPRANADKAAESILQVTQKLQGISPEAPVFVLGDFNHCSLKKCLRDFHQYVTCPTRQKKSLDLCYGSIKDAYKALPLPPLGGADHNCVQLIPSYRTALRRGKTLIKHVKNWTEEAILSLKGCFDCTDWGMFKESCTNINDLTDVVSCYVSYCVDNVIPDKIAQV